MKIQIADIEPVERRNESELHWQVKSDIDRLLTMHGFDCRPEYPVITCRCIRRVDLGIVPYQIAVEIWTVPTKPNYSIIKERAEELGRVGWRVVDINAKAWGEKETLWYIRQLVSRRARLFNAFKDILLEERSQP